MKLLRRLLPSWFALPTGVRPKPTGVRPNPTGVRPKPTGVRPNPTGVGSISESGLFQPVGGLLWSGLKEMRNLLYPPFCTVCALPTVAGTHLCTGCAGEAAQLRWGAPALCRKCSRPFWGAAPLPVVCLECQQWSPAFDCVVAPCRFGGVVREVVHQLKYDGKRHLRHLVSDWMQEGLSDARLRDPPADVLVPVPLHWWKQRLRGFNQAEVLAAELSLSTGVRMIGALRRVRSTGTQTQLAREERRANVRGAFATRPACERQIRERHVLLVDDVLTTGATLDACARALLRGGAASVRALTAARG
jgi:ComF family protein